MKFRGTQIEVSQPFLITTHWRQKYEVEVLYIEKDYFYLKYLGKSMPVAFSNTICDLVNGDIFIMHTRIIKKIDPLETNEV